MEKRVLRRHRKRSVIILATLAIFISYFILLCPDLWSSSQGNQSHGTYNYMDKYWILEKEDGSFSTQVMPREFMKLENNTVYRMHTTISYDGIGDENPYLFLEVSHRYCRLFLDDEMIFSFMPENIQKLDHSKSPGYLYKAIPLPDNFYGKKLTVEFIPALHIPMEYEIPMVFYGDYGTTIRTIVKEELPHIILTVLCMVLGFAALIFSAASFTGSDYREGFNIGIFALLVSLYFFAECRTVYYFVGNPYFVYFINLFALSLMPLAFMGVLREFTDGVHKKICSGVIIFEMTFFFVELLLHLTGIMDMREFLSIIHVIGFTEVTIVFFLFLAIGDPKKRNSLLLQLLPISAGMIADAVIYWKHLDIGLFDTTFTTIGLILFLFRQLITKVIQQARRLTDMQQHVIESMATLIESRDGSTGAHVKNTGVYARMIAKEMFYEGLYPEEIDSEFIDRIGWMAPLHDVGKIKISDTILNKPGKFTPEEYEIMKTHAALGGEIIKEIMSRDMDPEIVTMAVNIATYHHERWDGKGYPDGKKGTEIPLCARIMAVADVFDALSSKRVYKPEMSIDEVFAELKANENKQFQKEIVEIVLRLRPKLEEYLKKNKNKQ